MESQPEEKQIQYGKREWDLKWTYGVVTEFMKTAEILAFEKEKEIDELMHLLMVIIVGHGNLVDAARILGEHYDSEKS
jgi:UDP-N-acetylglucosamine transferase subunit ALG13